ncbi:D-amino acid dehydrogenase [uncultured Azonexus sp.]|uniref:D-amino acid dehydrogenase n=1 Tax=uncultured Azonexus sp. TaxID=520307 RepID=UPI00262EB930|nr:D-amino acid dehydrogenase [uncultured Azonexus sp.]
MKILVLGAGVVGTCSAWYLQAAGHEVTVVDRQPAAGMETSFANGGQISVSHAEPWANPHVLPRLLKWLGRRDAPLLWHWRADPQQWLWGLRFLRECLPGRVQANVAAILALALDSRRRLQILREELALDYDQLQRGILHVYTDRGELAAAMSAARLMARHGLEREMLDAAACVAIEPALAGAADILVGGDYTASDESGDAHRFTQALAERARQAGVIFQYGVEVERIASAGGQVAAVVVNGEGGPRLLTADAYVLALGSYSPLLLRPLGIGLPVYPAKGYSATLTLADDSHAPSVSITDDERKLVFSRLGNRLRVAGTAEFNGYDLSADPVRCQALIDRTRQLFPKLAVEGEPAFWCGLRPATPSNVPLIGRSRLSNLWLNTGHGTLGWTMACGSGAALADLVGGRRPVPEFPFLRG